MVVDLPAPFGPINATQSLQAILKEMASTATEVGGAKTMGVTLGHNFFAVACALRCVFGLVTIIIVVHAIDFSSNNFYFCPFSNVLIILLIINYYSAICFSIRVEMRQGRCICLNLK